MEDDIRFNAEAFDAVFKNLYNNYIKKEQFNETMKQIKFIDAETNQIVEDASGYVRGIVYVCDDYVEYGWFKSSPKNIMVLLKGDGLFGIRTTAIGLSREALPSLVWSNMTGYYVHFCSMDKDLLFTHTHTYGQGNFPYQFPKHYEAVENFKLFKDAQKVLDESKEYPLAKHLKYTFGVEFETSMGYVPQDLCFRDGLIPLRDGSISGIEYSTVVLKGNKGLALLEQQLETLKTYTKFNKECALHFHFGGFPVNSVSIYALYCLWYVVENDLMRRNYLPSLSFNTDEYKANGKDYCKRLPPYCSFEEMYKAITTRKYYGSLVQPHPADIEKRAKWNIKSRYYGLNLVNMVCYKGPKTVEFRFLRPSFNLKKITLWMYIFNGVLKQAEKIANEWRAEHAECPNNTGEMLSWVIEKRYHGIKSLLKDAYINDLSAYNTIEEGLNLLQLEVSLQSNNGDHCGRDTFFEDELFS